MFKFLNRPTLREKINLRQGISDKGRTAVLEFTLPQGNTEAVIGGGHSAGKDNKELLEDYIVSNIDEVHSGDVNVEETAQHYKAQIRIENKRPDHVESIDEQMAQHFSIEDSRIHVI